jgi:hypothetical protein
MSTFYEGRHHHFQTISSHVESEVAGLDDYEWQDFLVAADIFEGSRASGRPPGRVVIDLEDRLFALDTTVYGGKRRFICSRRGRDVLVAVVVSRSRRIGQREINEAKAALEQWRRASGPARPDGRDP